MINKLLLTLSLVFYSSQLFAWGARGHSLICETAAYLVSRQTSESETAEFLKDQSFQLGYYCNVPDFIWKRPRIYKRESINHYMNLEDFPKELKIWSSEKDSASRLSRSEFAKKYPKLNEKKGRAWWRVQELNEKWSEISKQLNNKQTPVKKHQDSQLQWLVVAGVLGHYVGDMAMPLHISSNHDGQLTGQAGLHAYFESEMVNELYLTQSSSLQGEVYKKAFEKWPKFLKEMKGKDSLQLVQSLSKDSHDAIKELLALDKSQPRNSVSSSAEKFKPLIEKRLVQGVLYYSLFLYRQKNWKANNKRFYHFDEAPKFIEPPKAKSKSSPKAA